MTAGRTADAMVLWPPWMLCIQRLSVSMGKQSGLT